MPGVRGRHQDPEWVRKRIEARRRTIAAKPDFYKTFWTGHPQTEEARKIMSEKKKAFYASHPEAREALRQAHLGKAIPEEVRKKISESNAGREFSVELRKKISESLQGEKHPNWKGGITPINTRIRGSREYKLWRKAVFERDNYTCQNCGQVGGYLEADHIKPFALFLELRFDINNGRTLCRPCHKELGWELSREGLREKDTGRFIGKGGLIYVN